MYMVRRRITIQSITKSLEPADYFLPVARPEVGEEIFHGQFVERRERIYNVTVYDAVGEVRGQLLTGEEYARLFPGHCLSI